MQSVHLHQLKFRAFHGLYEEERKTGSEYEVHVSVDFNPPKDINDLGETIDYVQLYEIISNAMYTPQPLLEMVADAIIKRICVRFPGTTAAAVEIWKLNPPIEKFDGKVGISIRKTFPAP
jgi:dihydroneopterin aldolase